MRRISAIGSSDSGFTLLEILVAMAIVSLAALGLSLAWPNWIEAGESRRAMLELKSFLSTAQEAAISSGTSVSLTYDAASRRFIAAGEKYTLQRSVHADFQGSAGQAGITFFPDGSSSGGEISISTPRQSALLRIGRLTGAVHE